MSGLSMLIGCIGDVNGDGGAGGAGVSVPGPEREGPSASTEEALSVGVCPSVGTLCGVIEIPGGDRNTAYTCAVKGNLPSATKKCASYCVYAGAARKSFCGTTLKLPAADLSLFASANLDTAYGEILWADQLTGNTITAHGGHSLVDPAKSSTPCKSSPQKTCVNAGVQCAGFVQAETGTTATGTASWAPLTPDQMSAANAVDGTAIATFSGQSYGYVNGLLHAAFKCGGSTCDSNWGLDQHVRRHAINTSAFAVVAIPSN